jgi:hypothetical protein
MWELWLADQWETNERDSRWKPFVKKEEAEDTADFINRKWEGHGHESVWVYVRKRRFRGELETDSVCECRDTYDHQAEDELTYQAEIRLRRN